jgi:predicted metal-dependent phosphoesterase TrpH
MTDFRCELHMHSTYSDGSVTPEGLLRHAKTIGLAVVAITDHENARGSRAALPIALELELDFIPAIEFSARWDNFWGPGTTVLVDVLGYFIDLDNAALQQREREALADMRERIAACCVRLTAAGYPVTIEEVYAANPMFAGLRYVREILARKGFGANSLETGQFVNPIWEAGPASRFTLGDQIAVIHAAGGVAVLAHPGYYQHTGKLLQMEQIAALVHMGIDGLEIYHRAHDTDTRAHFLALAEQADLLVTGGSDEHGWSPELPLMGTEPVTQAMVDALRDYHQLQHRKRRE